MMGQLFRKNQDQNRQSFSTIIPQINCSASNRKIKNVAYLDRVSCNIGLDKYGSSQIQMTTQEQGYVAEDDEWHSKA